MAEWQKQRHEQQVRSSAANRYASGKMFRFSRSLRELSATGLVASGLLLSITFLSLAKLDTTRSLSQYVGAICATVLQSSPAAEAPFISENIEAMKKMMVEMGIKPTGDVDRDFVAMMVPHHQGAIDMAQALLRYGNNERLRRLAQEIIVTQQQEIAAMRLAVGEPLPPMVAAADQPSAAASPTHLQILKPQ
jgi:Domain of unknown function (DUF305)